MNQMLAQIAEREAKKNYQGNSDNGMGNLYPFLELFAETDEVTEEALNADWSGAFAFWCVQGAGYGLPLRYPDTRVHGCFAWVPAWVEFARLPKIHLWHSPSEALEVGDLVVFSFREGKPPRMGIVLELHEDTMDVAVGNYHNHSAVVECPVGEGILGFLRLPSI